MDCCDEIIRPARSERRLCATLAMARCGLCPHWELEAAMYRSDPVSFIKFPVGKTQKPCRLGLEYNSSDLRLDYWVNQPYSGGDAGCGAFG